MIGIYKYLIRHSFCDHKSLFFGDREGQQYKKCDRVKAPEYLLISIPVPMSRMRSGDWVNVHSAFGFVNASDYLDLFYVVMLFLHNLSRESI